MKIKSILFVLLLTSCASRPVLYPNERYKNLGKKSANKYIDTCVDEADEYLESGKAKNVAKSTGAGAFIGGAMGAVKGLFTGNVVSGSLEGAAIGGAGGAAVGALTPDEIKRRYVNQCLANNGLKVIGWD